MRRHSRAGTLLDRHAAESIPVHRSLLALALVTACATDPDPDAPGDGAIDVCTGGTFRCLAQARVAAADGFSMFASTEPKGFGPDELARAYSIPRTGTTTPTVAIVVAFGYAKLAADLAAYRDQFDLPPCTLANGCLRIVNQDGDASPLPPDAPPDNDWTLETMLDVAMASAACPRCRLLVVQSDDTGTGLIVAQDTAVELGADVPGYSGPPPEALKPESPVATNVATPG